jgi:hypothetical protein
MRTQSTRAGDRLAADRADWRQQEIAGNHQCMAESVLETRFGNRGRLNNVCHCVERARPPQLFHQIHIVQTPGQICAPWI